MKWEFKLVTGIFIYISGVFSFLLGGFDPTLLLLIYLMVADISTGFMGAIYNKNINSDKVFKGGLKKISIFIVISVAVQVDTVFNNALPLREIVIIYYMVEEFLSFVENVSIFITLPEQVIKYFEKLKEGEKSNG